MRLKYISFFISSLFSLAFFSCSAPYSVTTNPRLISNWKVTSIVLEGDVADLQVPTPVFNDANINCFTSSKWTLSDGGTGFYNMPADDTTCVSGVRRISWEVVNLKDAHYFQFYRYIAPNGILVDRFTTYIMEIFSLTKTSMVLKYPIKYQGKTGSLVFSFSKGK